MSYSGSFLWCFYLRRDVGSDMLECYLVVNVRMGCYMFIMHHLGASVVDVKTSR
jgi:hypothetical protein